MAEAILMVALSPTMRDGVIAEWVASEGQALKAGDVLCEVETDKATMAYESPTSGTLLKILKTAGSSSAVGDAIAVIGKPGEDWSQVDVGTASGQPDGPRDESQTGNQTGNQTGSPAAKQPASPQPAQPASSSAKLPASQPNSIPASQSANLPAMPELPARIAGESHASAVAGLRSTVSIPDTVARPAPAGVAAEAAPGKLVAGNSYQDHAPGLQRASPLARKLARTAGLDIRTVAGSGPDGRVVARDIAAAGQSTPGQVAGQVASLVTGQAMVGVSAAGRPAADAAAQAFSQTAGKNIGQVGGHSRPQHAASGLRDERAPLSRMRSVIAERLGASWNQAPHFFVRSAVDMQRLLAFRSIVNTGREKALGLNAFIMKLTASALQRHPIINASWEGDAIRYLGHADIGLAVALDGGLITPVVRSCEALGIAAIDAILADLVPRARAGALQPEEYNGASFTISNLGSSGVEEFTAIINPPGSAILALGAIADEAVVRNGAVVPGKIMHVTMSADHRVIDGAVAAAFMADLKALLEEPATALV
jgi:pyruvate dehydrogenase E2 component (dihydrolipoamide acetyltransferase)